MNFVWGTLFAGSLALMAQGKAGAQGGALPIPALAHVRNQFQFTVPASLERAAVLFGPEGERGWAGEQWDPVFFHPQPARDQEGAVFTIQHGEHTAVWVNTVFDLPSGHMQYVYFLPETLVTTVDVRLHATAPSETQVTVTYERTALTEAANARVETMGEKDRRSGPEWQVSIAHLLGKTAEKR